MITAGRRVERIVPHRIHTSESALERLTARAPLHQEDLEMVRQARALSSSA